MSSKIVCAALFALMGVTPALAQNAVCTEPVVPVAVDGNTVTRDKLVAAIAQAKDFMAKSDVYQNCIADDLKAKQDVAAKANTPFDNEVSEVATAKIAANQQAKNKLADDLNAQEGLFKRRTASN